MKMPSLHDQDDVRLIGFQPLIPQQPQGQWFAMPSPDGSGDFTPFKYGKLPTPQPLNRRFGPNDESGTNR